MSLGVPNDALIDFTAIGKSLVTAVDQDDARLILGVGSADSPAFDDIVILDDAAIGDTLTVGKKVVIGTTQPVGTTVLAFRDSVGSVHGMDVAVNFNATNNRQLVFRDSNADNTIARFRITLAGGDVQLDGTDGTGAYKSIALGTNGTEWRYEPIYPRLRASAGNVTQLIVTTTGAEIPKILTLGQGTTVTNPSLQLRDTVGTAAGVDVGVNYNASGNRQAFMRGTGETGGQLAFLFGTGNAAISGLNAAGSSGQNIALGSASSWILPGSSGTTQLGISGTPWGPFFGTSANLSGALTFSGQGILDATGGYSRWMDYGTGFQIGRNGSPIIVGNASASTSSLGTSNYVHVPNLQADGNLTASGNGFFSGVLGANGRLYTNTDLRLGGFVGNGFSNGVVNSPAVRLIDNLTPSGDMGLVWGMETSAYPKLQRSGTKLRVELADASGTLAPFECSNLTASGTGRFNGSSLRVGDNGGNDSAVIYLGGGTRQAVLEAAGSAGNNSLQLYGNFVAATLYLGGNTDTALAYNSAGVFEINNGTKVSSGGAYRDLNLRNLSASGRTLSGSGTRFLPGYSFGDQGASGMFLNISPLYLGFSVQETEALKLSTTTAEFAGLVYTPNGYVTIPSHSFTNDPDTGWYLFSANRMAAAAGGKIAAEIDHLGGSSNNCDAGTTLKGYDIYAKGTITFNLTGRLERVNGYVRLVNDGSSAISLYNASSGTDFLVAQYSGTAPTGLAGTVYVPNLTASGTSHTFGSGGSTNLVVGPATIKAVTYSSVPHVYTDTLSLKSLWLGADWGAGFPTNWSQTVALGGSIGLSLWNSLPITFGSGEYPGSAVYHARMRPTATKTITFDDNAGGNATLKIIGSFVVQPSPAVAGYAAFYATNFGHAPVGLFPSGQNGNNTGIAWYNTAATPAWQLMMDPTGSTEQKLELKRYGVATPILSFPVAGTSMEVGGNLTASGTVSSSGLTIGDAGGYPYLSAASTGITFGKSGTAFNLFVAATTSGRVGLGNNSQFGWSSSSDPSGTQDVYFQRTAAGTCGLTGNLTASGTGTFANGTVYMANSGWVGSYPAIWLDRTSPSSTNYSIASVAGYGLAFNAPGAEVIVWRLNAADRMQLNNVAESQNLGTTSYLHVPNLQADGGITTSNGATFKGTYSGAASYVAVEPTAYAFHNVSAGPTLKISDVSASNVFGMSVSNSGTFILGPSGYSLASLMMNTYEVFLAANNHVYLNTPSVQVGSTLYRRMRMYQSSSGRFQMLHTDSTSGTKFLDVQLNGSAVRFPLGIQVGGNADLEGAAGGETFNVDTIGNVTIGLGAQIMVGGGTGVGNRGRMRFDNDGLWVFTNSAQSGFNRLIFGTNNTSGISLKKSGTDFHFRLGDDSAYTGLYASTLYCNGGWVVYDNLYGPLFRNQAGTWNGQFFIDNNTGSLTGVPNAFGWVLDGAWRMSLSPAGALTVTGTGTFGGNVTIDRGAGNTGKLTVSSGVSGPQVIVESTWGGGGRVGCLTNTHLDFLVNGNACARIEQSTGNLIAYSDLLVGGSAARKFRLNVNNARLQMLHSDTTSGSKILDVQMNGSAVRFPLGIQSGGNADLDGAAGGATFTVDTSGNLSASGRTLSGSGTRFLPGYSFGDQGALGMFLNISPLYLGFSVGETETLKLSTAEATVSGNLIASGTGTFGGYLYAGDFILSTGVALKLMGGASGIQMYSNVVPNGSRSLGVNGAEWTEVWTGNLTASGTGTFAGVTVNHGASGTAKIVSAYSGYTGFTSGGGLELNDYYGNNAYGLCISNSGIFTIQNKASSYQFTIGPNCDAAARTFFAMEGSVFQPGLRVDTVSGLYRIGTNIVGMGCNQTEVQRWSAGATSITGNATVAGTIYVGSTANEIWSQYGYLNLKNTGGNGVTIQDSSGVDRIKVSGSNVTLNGNVYTGHLKAYGNAGNTYDIGENSYRYRDGYFAGTLYSGSFSGAALSVTTGITSNGYIIAYGNTVGLNYNGAAIRLVSGQGMVWGASLDSAWRTRLRESAAGTLTVDNGAGGAATLAVTGTLQATTTDGAVTKVADNGQFELGFGATYPTIFFGGRDTAGRPKLVAVGTNLQWMLSDESAFAPIQGSEVIARTVGALTARLTTFSGSIGVVDVTDDGTNYAARMKADEGLKLGVNRMIKFGPNAAVGSEDVGICRNSAGLLEINNSTSGTYRDLRLRNIEVVGDIGIGESLTFTKVNDGNTGTAKTINWSAGNRHEATLTDNVTFTFTAPAGAASLILLIKQDATGGRTITWPATVKWPGGVAPTPTSAANSIDLYTFYYDGTNYYGAVGQNYS